MAQTAFALSLKQPWATLLVHGHKTIEVRRWSTQRRGRFFIHAARVPDPRKEAWAKVPPELKEAAGLSGGIVGAGILDDCLEYRTVEAFSADLDKHLNELSWFEKPVLYGFAFSNLAPLPFRPCLGWMRFFPVSETARTATASRRSPSKR